MYHIEIDSTGVAWLVGRDSNRLGYLDKAEIDDLRCSCEFALMDLEHVGEHGADDWMRDREG